MRYLLTVLTCLLILSPNVVMSETVKYQDLVKRNGLYYKKFTDVPFTGRTSGRIQCSYKKGKKHGPWFSYYENGQLLAKGTYKDGKQDGPWVSYWSNGQLGSKGTYKNSQREGPWKFFKKDGTKRVSGRIIENLIIDEGTGTYKNDKKISD